MTTQRKLFPPLIVRIIAAGFLMTAGIVRWFTVTGDHATVNILTVLAILLSCVTLGIWFAFFSGYSRAIRSVVTVAVIGSIALFFGLLRVEHLSGELVPTFRPRWQKRLDETLQPAKPADIAIKVDLTATTPDDFPQFNGPQRNGRIEQVTLSQDWQTNPPRRLWKQPIGAGWSAFAAANGFAVTQEQRGPEELVTCYEISSGKLVWSHSHRSRHHTVPGGIGPRATPAIFDGHVYSLGATGEFVCLEGSSGAVRWRLNLLEKYQVPEGTDENGVAWGRSNSPLIVDDLVVVPAGGPAGGTKVSLLAVNRNTGEVVWETGDQQVSYSSPILTTLAGTRQIVCVHEKSVSGYDPKTGQELWAFVWPGNSTQDANVSQPVPLDDNRMLLSKGYGKGAAVIRIEEKSATEFQVTTEWQDTSVLKTKFTSAIAYQGHAYGLSDGIMECVELKSGKRKWKKGRFGQGQILGVGDQILIQAESGEVVLIAASSKGLEERGRFQAIDGKTWNNLCLYGKRLLVRNSEEAACYELP